MERKPNQSFDMIPLRQVLPMLLALALVITGGAGCTKAARKDRYFASADRDFKSEQYDKAEIEYLKVLQIPPVNPVAIQQLGFIYYNEGRLPQAFAYLRKAAELAPEKVEVRLKLGLIYMADRQLKEARQEALWVLDQQPGNEEALLLLADTAATPKEIPELQQRIGKLREKDKDRSGYHLALGWLFLRQQDVSQAENEFQKAVALDPKSSAVNLALGNLRWMQKDLKQAGQAFQTAAEMAPIRSMTRLKHADFKLKTGALDEAKKILEEITAKAPDYVPAWSILMQVAFAEKKYEDCAALVNKVLARDAANYDARLLSGRLKLVKGEGDKAVAEFERMKTLYGRVPQVHYQLALAHLLNNDVSKALGSLNQAVTLEPNFADALLLLAELNLRKGNSVPAITSLTALVKQQPQIAQAHLLLATAYLTQNNFSEAVAVYGRMMGLFPKNPQVPLLMGIILAQQKKMVDARQAFEKSLELSPDYLPALEQLVDLDLFEKQSPKAMERIKKQIEKNPAVAEPQLLLAKIFIVQGDSNPAEAALLKAIELNPDLQMAYLLLAQLYVTSNKHQQALERLTGLVAKTNDVTALMQIGTIHDALKNYDAARDAYERLLKANPRYSPAINNLAYLYSEHLGELDKAYVMAEKARQLLPYEPHTSDTLGWILYRRGEYSRALGLIQESAAKLPTEPEVQLHLGMTHYMMSEEKPARLALQRALQSDRVFPGQEEARRRLAILAMDAKSAGADTRASLEKWVREQPGDPVALGILAALYERDGNSEKAAKTYEAALKQNPKNVQIMIKLAELYSLRPKDLRTALNLAKDAHSLAPDDASISCVLGRLVFRTGDHQWALSLLQDAARKLPDQPELLRDLAWAYYGVGQVGEAEASMREALRIGAALPEAEGATRFLAMVAASRTMGQAQQVAAQVQSILAVDSEYVPALMVSSLLQEQQGNFKESGRLYERVLVHYPFFTPAIRQLTMLYAEKLGDDQKANELGLKARVAFPDDAELARTLGLLAYRRGDYPRAAQLLKESAQKRSSDAELFYYLGLAHYRLKERDESKAALQRALALNVQTKFADEARRVISELK